MHITSSIEDNKILKKYKTTTKESKKDDETKKVVTKPMLAFMVYNELLKKTDNISLNIKSLNPRIIEEIIDEVLEQIIVSLSNWKKVQLNNFGTFRSDWRKSWNITCSLPKKGSKLPLSKVTKQVEAKAVAKMNFSSKLKSRIAQVKKNF